MHRSLKDLLKNNRTDYFFVTLLVFLGVISHLEWFRFGNILSFADIWFQNQETLKETFLTNTWIENNGFGIPNIQLYKLFFIAFWSFLGKSDLQFTDALRITHLIPIAILGFLSPYFLVKHLTKEKFIAFCGALFYGLTTPFIMRQYLGHSSIAFVVALAPLILYFFSLALEKNTIKQWIIFILLYWVGSCYELRIMYIVTIVLGIYFLFFGVTSLKKNWYKIFIITTLFIGLSAFWILPLSFGVLSKTIDGIVGRDLFGNIHYSLLTSFSLFHDSWTGSQPIPFSLQLIPWYFWIIPTVTVFFFLFRPGKENKKIITFFGVIWLLGLFITKQAGDPFPNAFQWLRESIPGFLVFRSSSKFWFVVSLGYLGLLSYGLLWFKTKGYQRLRKIIFFGVSSIIIIVSIYNSKPLITGKIGGMFEERNIPKEYIILNNFILEKSSYFRTFWIPGNSRWSIYTNQNPKVGNIDVITNEWKDVFNFKNKETLQNKIINVFRFSFSNQLFDLSSIRYVVVPLRDIANEDDFYISYGGKENSNIRNWYISELDKVEWLKKIDIGTKDLAVYENENYKPPIFAFNEIFNFNSFSNLDNKYNFITNELKKEFYFTVNTNDTKSSSLTNLNNVFESVSSKNTASSTLKVLLSQPDNDQNDLYQNLGYRELFVLYNNNKIIFYAQPRGDLLVNGKKISDGTKEKNILKTIYFSSDRDYYVLADEQLLPLVKNKELSLGNNDKKRNVQVFFGGENIISNPSFENGLWQKKVGDCNHRDDNSIMSVGLDSQNKTAGKYSLQLEATTHIACTSHKVPVFSPGEYLLSFDYQSSNAKQAGFYLGFNNPEKTIFKNKILITDSNWQTYLQKITIPEKTTSGRLYLYSYSLDGKTNIINRYDNFKLTKLSKLTEVYLPANNEFGKNTVDFENGDNTLVYQDGDYDYQNIISNPSFESGFWQEKVGDCHNYDKNPIIAMGLNREEKSDGAQSLQLEATRHISCTSVNIPVKSGGTYLLNFDYQSPNADKMSYYLGFNDASSTKMSENVAIKDKKWHIFSKNISIPEGATKLSLFVYAKPVNEKTGIVNRYDNFKLIEIPDLSDAYYLIGEPKTELKEPASTNFDLVNPTKKLVHIKGATTPFFLAMSESYHPQWQLQMNNNKIQGQLNKWWPFAKPDKVGDDYHYKLNDFLNAWYVDPNELCKNDNRACHLNPDGSYDLEMVIEFWPQRWFYLGLLISGTTLLGCLIFLVWDWRRRRAENKKLNVIM